MRTTIRLPDDLLAEAKRAAIEGHTTLTAIVEDALREMMIRRRHQQPAPPVSLTTVGGSGLQPGVDLNNGAELLDRMEDGDAAA